MPASSGSAKASLASPAITLSTQAYARIVLHAAKYPANTVRGLLVGRAAGPGTGAGTAVEVVDAIPLVHVWTDLTPATEVGCALAQAHLASSSSQHAGTGTTLVGVYEAPSVMGVREPSRAAVKLLRKVAANLGAAAAASPQQGAGGGLAGAVLLVVNNTLLLSPSSGHALLPFYLPAPSPAQGSSTTAAPPSTLSSGPTSEAEPQSLPSSSTTLARETETIRALEAAIQAGAAQQVYDFDDHLADTRQDWLVHAVPLAL